MAHRKKRCPLAVHRAYLARVRSAIGMRARAYTYTPAPGCVPLLAEGDREVEGSVIALNEQRHMLARFLSQLAQLFNARHGGVIQPENHIARLDPSPCRR